jgi:hypothetical protein
MCLGPFRNKPCLPPPHFIDTPPSYSESDRVNGNKKGVMTRQRQPKAAARLLRQRYLSLAQGYDTHSCPNGLLDYSKKIVYVN